MSFFNTFNATLATINTQWSANRNFFQLNWDRFLSVLGDDAFTVWVIGTTLVQLIVYWGYGSLFILLDTSDRPQFIQKYKLQKEKNNPASKDMLIKIVITVLRNQIIIGIPLTYVGYQLFMLRGMPPIHELPTFYTLIFDLAVLALLEEAAFYYSHRLFHTKYLYKHFHKKHHEWTAPIAVAAMYSHPLEHIFASISPILLQICLVRAHLLTAWIYFTIALVNILNDHSGYDFPFFKSSVRFHDLHHSKFNYNYGVFGILDRIHGTFKEENNEIQCKKLN